MRFWVRNWGEEGEQHKVLGCWLAPSRPPLPCRQPGNSGSCSQHVDSAVIKGTWVSVCVCPSLMPKCHSTRTAVTSSLGAWVGGSWQEDGLAWGYTVKCWHVPCTVRLWLLSTSSRWPTGWWEGGLVARSWHQTWVVFFKESCVTLSMVSSNENRRLAWELKKTKLSSLLVKIYKYLNISMALTHTFLQCVKFSVKICCSFSWSSAELLSPTGLNVQDCPLAKD